VNFPLDYIRNGSVVLVIFLAIINFGGLILMGIDKGRAKKEAWRIPEKRLFGIAFLGGALGVIMGMYMFRHKTQHRSFKYGIPLLLILNGVVIYYLFKLIFKV
jgi:uncharacterized membrane protein YsdA (DUF1294 family)